MSGRCIDYVEAAACFHYKEKGWCHGIPGVREICCKTCGQEVHEVEIVEEEITGNN
jgi:hypothetical protein